MRRLSVKRSRRQSIPGIGVFQQSGLLASFDPSLASVTGSAVDSWTQSGGSVSCTVSSTSTNRPQLVTVNGRNLIRYSAASSQRLIGLSNALAAALGGVTPYTFYCAVDIDDPGGGVNGTFTAWAVGAGTGYVHHPTNGLRDQYVRFDGAGSTSTLSAGSVWPVSMCVYASVFTGSSFSNYINGALVNSGPNTRNAGSTDILTIGCYVLGTGSYNGYLQGDLGRCLYYSGAHSAGQIARNTAWLRRYYGV